MAEEKKNIQKKITLELTDEGWTWKFETSDPKDPVSVRDFRRAQRALIVGFNQYIKRIRLAKKGARK